MSTFDFDSKGPGSTPGGAANLTACSCDNPEWIDDAGDGWQYCAACGELARPANLGSTPSGASICDGKLCSEDEESDPGCDAMNDGFCCTLRTDHEGPHIACGIDNHNLDIWA